MTTELEVTIQVIEGQKIGLRINNANVVCGVHPGTAAGMAGMSQSPFRPDPIRC